MAWVAAHALDSESAANEVCGGSGFNVGIAPLGVECVEVSLRIRLCHAAQNGLLLGGCCDQGIDLVLQIIVPIDGPKSVNESVEGSGKFEDSRLYLR